MIVDESDRVARASSPACVGLLDLCGRLNRMFRRIFPALLFALVVAGAVAAHAAGKPNIVLITLDSTRADRMGFLGSKAKITPNLDGLASQSMIFEQAYSQTPLTVGSHATILSGTYPQTHRVTEFGARLAPTLPFMPDLLLAQRISHRCLRRFHRARSKKWISSRLRSRIHRVRRRFSTAAAGTGQK